MAPGDLRFTGTAPGIGAYDVPYYHVDESALPADLGQLYETRSDYYQRFLGFEIAATKRMLLSQLKTAE